MRLLLDTHAFLWFVWNAPQLSGLARAKVMQPGAEVWLSAASYWEIAIKIGAGKLTLARPFLDFIQDAIRDNGFKVLPIELVHADAVVNLPRYHRDPFDRLIIAQAIVENFDLVSADAAFDLYSIRRVW